MFLAYRLLLDPLPIYSYWLWLIVPLALLFSVVYKTAKCPRVEDIPAAALAITVWIILGMATAAAVLTIVVKWQE